MLFNSWAFLVFYVVVFTAYHRLGPRAQNGLLVVASYFFYAWWDWRFLGLLWISTAVDFVVARRMERAEGTARKRLLLVSLATNLGILGFFKYFGFFAESATELLRGLGLSVHAPTLSVVLPVGISFYTFQTIGYAVDVYRGRVTACRDPIVFALYVAYFPQLVAGPIERAKRLLPQLGRPRRVTREALASGAVLILIGLVRKVAIADVAAAHVDRAFADPGGQTSAQLVLATLLFALQIYCDFAGYSDIARGTSRMLGIELMENFDHPYFSTSITEFWRRWHVSLSTWLRDYLYIPLGGNRGPLWFVHRNLVITMLLGGLWHGADWSFVFWGALHGAALVLHSPWKSRRRSPEGAPVRSLAGFGRAVAGWTVTMAFVGFAWIFFRAPDMATACEVVAGIAALDLGLPVRALLLPAVLVCLLLFIDVPQVLARDHAALLRWPWPLRGVTYAGLVLLLVVLRVEDEVPFIYFQF